MNRVVHGMTNHLDLVYFKQCLQEWTKMFLVCNARKKHYTFMRTKGSIMKSHALHVNQYGFAEAIYLYNEIGDFLWDDPQERVIKLTEAKLK